MKLKTKHLFKLISISNKIGFTKELKVLISGFSTKGLTEAEVEARGAEITADLLVKLIANIGEVEQELYELLAELTGTTPEAIEDQDINTTLAQVRELISSAEFTSFLSQPEPTE